MQYKFQIPTNQKQIDEIKVALSDLEASLKLLIKDTNEKSDAQIELIKVDTNGIHTSIVKQQNDLNELDDKVDENIKLISKLEVAISNFKLLLDDASSNLNSKQEVDAEKINTINTKVERDIERVNTLISDIFNVLEGKDEAILKLLGSNLKILENKISSIKIPTIVSDSSNVTISKRENEIGIAVDIPEITKEIIKTEVVRSGGISKATVQKMIDESVSPSPTPVELDAVLTYDAQGNLETYTTSGGTKTFEYDSDGNLINIVGTGIYPSKHFTYVDGNLTQVDVI
jgi:YD repeat-containing protein